MITSRNVLTLSLCGAVALSGIGCTPLHQAYLKNDSVGTEPVPVLGTRAASQPTQTRVNPAPPAPLPRWAESPPLSPGDRLQVGVEDGEGFSGRFEVDIDGALKLPYLPPLQVAGKDTAHAERVIADALVSAELFKPQRVRVSVRVHEWSHVQVHVSGAVFNPGLVTANARNAEERALKTNMTSGDFPSERMLAAALRAAGGVRPDAAVDAIQLIRDGRTVVVSYAGLTQGRAVPQIPLMSGDVIVVPDSGRFDPALMTPSAITPPGIRVFLSNLTVPASGNAIAAISKESSSLPYGSRLLTAALSANCVGGVNATNASRYTVLVRDNPLGGNQQVVERAIDDLLHAPQQDDINPYLMPGDGIACYDSGVTNLRDIARTLTDILLPLSLL